MDSFKFILGMTDSLAWPVAVILIVFLLRAEDLSRVRLKSQLSIFPRIPPAHQHVCYIRINHFPKLGS